MATEVLKGKFVKVIYETDSYGVARFLCDDAMPDDEDSYPTVVGQLPKDKTGSFSLIGQWTQHEGYGQRFQVDSYERFYKLSVLGLQRFLKDYVHGVGPKTAQKLVDAFGVQLEEKIAFQPEEILSLLGPKTGKKFLHHWNVVAEMGKISLRKFLANCGMSPAHVNRIWNRWQDQAVGILQQDPYQLTKISGLGFQIADRMALGMGWPLDSPQRTRGILSHLLREAAKESHTCLPREKLVKLSAEDCQVVPAVMEKVLDEQIQKGELKEEVFSTLAGPVAYVYLRHLYDAESLVAARCAMLLPAAAMSGIHQLETELQEAEQELQIQATDRQKQAVCRTLQSAISILTGGPGTGKSSTVRLIVEIAKRRNWKLELCAPTGRAAKHISNITAHNAQTIHRLLQFNPKEGSWKFNAQNPLSADLIVVDEVSMVDIELARRLFDAIPIGCHVLLIGDIDQLPAVGCGRVLEDMIASQRIPLTRLDKIFRQAGQSLIVTSAHDVVKGQRPVLPIVKDHQGKTTVSFHGDWKSSDAFLVDAPHYVIQRKRHDDPKGVQAKVVELVRQRLPEKYGFDPIRDIQVLVPMREKACGAAILNRTLQKALNPVSGSQKVSWQGTEFRRGDRVMVMQNTYDLNVFNGDIGMIEQVSQADDLLLINFYGNRVSFPKEKAGRLSLAYCSTIHKSQGSEYPAVVVVLLGQHRVMLQRNLLYTAITRAKKLLVLLSSPWALSVAVENITVNSRHTLLRQRLEKLIAKNSHGYY